MRQFGLETAVQLHRCTGAVQAVDVDRDDSRDRLHGAMTSLRLTGWPNCSFLERKCIAQCVIRRRQNLLRFVIRIDLDFACNLKEAVLIRDHAQARTDHPPRELP